MACRKIIYGMYYVLHMVTLVHNGFGFDALSIPNQTSGMELFNPTLQLGQGLNPSLGPFHVCFGLVFPIFQNTIGVKHSSVIHLLDKRCRCRTHIDPSQCRNGFGNGRQVVEELTTTTSFTVGLDFVNFVSHWFLEGRQITW